MLVYTSHPDFHQVDLHFPLCCTPHYDHPVGTSGIAGNRTDKCILHSKEKDKNNKLSYTNTGALWK